MKFGACVSIASADKAAIIRDSGYDYAEVGFNGFSELPEDEWQERRDAFLAVGIPVLCANCFLSGSVDIYADKDGDQDQNKRYLYIGAARAHSLGIKKVVFGSGGVRRVPEGMDRDKAYTKLVAFTTDAARILSDFGILLVIEPLNKKETNMINTVADGVKLARDTGSGNVKGLGDIYHMYKEQESFTADPSLAGMLSHCHISDPHPDGRDYPTDPGEFDYRGFLGMMSACGCDTCSVEASCDDLASRAPLALHTLRSIKF